MRSTQPKTWKNSAKLSTTPRWDVFLWNFCETWQLGRFATGQGMFREKNHSRSGKSQNCSLSQEKLTFCRKAREEFNTADLLPLKGGRSIWDHCDLKDIFPSWRRKICWKRISLVNHRVERMVVSWGYKPPLDLTFCSSLIREMWFLSGKSQGMLKNDVCGNRLN